MQAAQLFLPFYYKIRRVFIHANQLLVKFVENSIFIGFRWFLMFRKFLSIFYNFHSQCFPLFSKSPNIFRSRFSLWILKSADILFNFRFVMIPFLMSYTISERSFSSLQLLCFEFSRKISFRGSKQLIIGLGRLDSWRILESKMRWFWLLAKDCIYDLGWYGFLSLRR